MYIVELDKVTSTNDELKQLAEKGAHHFTVVTAKRQTKGRGRYDRKWESPVGNLYLSVLFKESFSPLISFIAAVSVRETIGNKAKLKWPNDVLIEGKKVAGILLETVEGEYTIVGIGINIAAAPKYAAKIDDDIKRVRDILLARLWHNFKEFKAKGFAPIRDKWLEGAEFLGQEIKVDLQNIQIKGIFEGLSSAGELELKTENELKFISSGEIYG